MHYKSLDTHILKRASKDDERQVFSFVASTSSPDRYGDIVGQNWDLSKFRNNPVILLNHNANQLPIGRGEVDVIDGKLMVDVEFDMGDPMAAEVARKVREGFIGAVSVGFNPIESTPRSMLPKDSPYYGKRGQYFESAELLEISVVTIPANGEAVAAKSISIEQIIRSEIRNLFGGTSQKKEFLQKDFVEIEAPEGHHWMDYEDGPVLMVGDSADHDGASKTFRFEVVEEHDPDRMKQKEPEEPEETETMPKDDEDKEDMSHYDDEDSDEEKAEGEDDKEDKSFLTNQERDLFALLTNGE